jgi:hypothetical protein
MRIVINAECCYAKFYYAKCHFAECQYAECHYAKCYYAKCYYDERCYAECRGQWKGINCKQSTKWQHLSRLKASTFFSLQKIFLVVMKHSNLYLGLVLPSGG